MTILGLFGRKFTKQVSFIDHPTSVQYASAKRMIRLLLNYHADNGGILQIKIYFLH